MLELKAKSIRGVNPLQWRFEGNTIVGLVVQTEVNFGEVGLNMPFDIWEDLNDAEKEMAGKVYNRIYQIIESKVLGE